VSQYNTDWKAVLGTALFFAAGIGITIALVRAKEKPLLWGVNVDQDDSGWHWTAYRFPDDARATETIESRWIPGQVWPTEENARAAGISFVVHNLKGRVA
jgi:hypothetical protein